MLKKILLCAVTACLALAVTGTCCFARETEDETDSVRKVIIDTDTGADDASALILAAKSPNIEILGVTVLAGNVSLEQGAENALMALELAGSDAPVYCGLDENYSGEKISVFSVFGADGMGEEDLIHPTKKVQEQGAVDFILETVDRYPDEVEIVALGPATNIARAIEQDPETMGKVKKIWSMGTAGLGPGNATPVAEFNVYNDAEAYKIMLDSGIDTTIIGLDMCGGDAMWTDADFEELKEKGDIGEFITSSFAKIREFYASNGSAGSVMDCDACAMMCVVDPDFLIRTIRCHGSCITDPGETYGQVIFYQEGFSYDMIDNDFDYNVSLAAEVDKAEYFRLYLSSLK